MFATFFRFEVRYWLRGFTVWIFFLVVAGLLFAGSSTGVWKVLENTHRNSPFLVEFFYSRVGLLSLLMTTVFVSAAAVREFAYDTHQIVFSAPVRKWPFLLGRCGGAALIAVIPLLGVSAGNILATFMPWTDPARWGPTPWAAHFWGIATFAVPNTLFAAAVLFSVAMLTRSSVASFLSALLLMAGYIIGSGSLGSRLGNENLAAMLDPFATQAFAAATKYWTVAEKNSLTLIPTGVLLWNRLLWLAIGAAIFFASGWRTSFAERTTRRRRAPEPQDFSIGELAPLPGVRPHFGIGASWAQFRSAARLEFHSLVRSTAFMVLLGAALVATLPALIQRAGEVLGNPSFPVTYHIEILRGDLQLFILAILTFFSGALVWKERDVRWDEIQDSSPAPNWVPFAAKFVALMAAVVLIELLCVLAGIAIQMRLGYPRHQIGLYFSEMFFWQLLQLVCVGAAAFFCHVLASHKYVGYFLFIVLLVINAFGWAPLGVESHLVRFATTPSYTYSDMFHYGPYLEGLGWFTAYWLLFSALLAICTLLLWPRGKDIALRSRIREAGRNWHGPVRFAALATAVLFSATGIWAFYNTKIRHEFVSFEERLNRQADYERKYKKYRDLPQPRPQRVKYSIDLYPEQAAMHLTGDQLLRNASAAPISEVHLNLASHYDTEVRLERGRLKLDDKRLRYRIYELSPPLRPGETMHMRYTVQYRKHGFENEVGVTEIVANGTFVSSRITPQIGYIRELELAGKNERRRKGLPEQDLMPPLDRNRVKQCAGPDWPEVETIISTSADQIAVAPGSLVREWTEHGRRHFHYRLDQPSPAFYSFLSARYQVAREEWNGVRMEVYFHPEHSWNVRKMLNGIRSALEYCSTNFGPYPHKEARIVEFPRVARFAQAFPGTVPYSESIGFIADLRNPDNIDHVLFVVAHEMAHQWWGHQLVPARTQGATLLSETLAQYSALMVVERTYGRDMMRKFLAYEMDRYLSGRGRELLKERPLLRVEPAQAYAHYDKGSVVMYYLKEMIGEEAINRALRGMLREYAYAPVRPTSYALLDALREQMPAELRNLLQDLFEDITIFSNRTLAAAAEKQTDGKYSVHIEVETKKFKGGEDGNEKEVQVNDYSEIGAFAAAPRGRKYGRTLYRKRVLITQPRNQYSFTVDELPAEAGIDPFSLLVDRVPGDNLKKVEIR